MCLNKKLVHELSEKKLNNMTEKILKLGKYRHYKTENLYQVIDVAHHSETLEEMVVYKALFHCKEFGSNSLWVRPKSMFLEDVEYNGHIVPRFQFIDAND